MSERRAEAKPEDASDILDEALAEAKRKFEETKADILETIGKADAKSSLIHEMKLLEYVRQKQAFTPGGTESQEKGGLEGLGDRSVRTSASLPEGPDEAPIMIRNEDPWTVFTSAKPDPFLFHLDEAARDRLASSADDLQDY